jgi:hypothetical protein
MKQTEKSARLGYPIYVVVTESETPSITVRKRYENR